MKINCAMDETILESKCETAVVTVKCQHANGDLFSKSESVIVFGMVENLLVSSLGII